MRAGVRTSHETVIAMRRLSSVVRSARDLFQTRDADDPLRIERTIARLRVAIGMILCSPEFLRR